MLLHSFLVFKGAPNGRIANGKFAMYLNHGHHVCQKKSWMDEDVMNKEIDMILILWKNAKAPGIIPILILDAYHVHMMGNIVNQIQSLGIEVIHIPAGCTYVCRPVDVRINTPIKTPMGEKWE